MRKLAQGEFAIEDDNPPTKRCRLNQKSNASHIQLLKLLCENVTWEDATKAADAEAPRVGPKAFESRSTPTYLHGQDSKNMKTMEKRTNAEVLPVSSN